MLKSCAFQDWLPKEYEVRLVAKNMVIVPNMRKYAVDIIMSIKCNV